MQATNVIARNALADLTNELESLKPSESGCADEFSWAVKIERFRPVALQAGARAAQLTDILAVAMRPLRKTELTAQMSEGQVLQLEELSERCGGLLGALHDAWHDGDGALRPEFAKPKKGKAAGDV